MFFIFPYPFLKPLLGVSTLRKNYARTVPVIFISTIIIIKVLLYTLISLVLACIDIHPIWLFFCFYSIIILILFKYYFLWMFCITLCLGYLGLHKFWALTGTKKVLKPINPRFSISLYFLDVEPVWLV